MKRFVSTIAATVFAAATAAYGRRHLGAGTNVEVRTNETIDVKNVSDTSRLFYRYRE